jgi:hypothetical protein
MMRLPLFFAAGVLGLLAGCAGQTIKPAEVLDESTGTTVGALQEPIEFVQNARNADLANGKRTSFAYLGPIEWDRMGEITYGLWIHVAPGNDAQVGSIVARGAVTLDLDEGPLVLTPDETPGEGHGPYKPVVSWGQTAYFKIDLEMLKRIAASRKLVLDFRSLDQSGTVQFLPTHDTSATLTEFARTRGITGD